MKKLFLLILLATPLLAATDAVLDCGKPFVFREEGDYFVIEVEEANKQGTLIGGLLGGVLAGAPAVPPDGKIYKMKARILKFYPHSTRPQLNCLFHKDEPLLLYCNQGIVEKDVELTEVASGTKQTIEVWGLTTNTQIVEREAVVDFDTTQKEKTLELNIEAWTTNSQAIIKTEMKSDECKAGTPVERPVL